MIGDGLGGDKEMIALAPREEPAVVAMTEKPYVAKIKKAITIKPTLKDDPVEDKGLGRDSIKPLDMALDIIPTIGVEVNHSPYQTLMEKKKKN